MAPRRRNKFKEWILDLFSAKDEIHYIPDGPPVQAGPSGFFNHAQHFALYNPTMTYVQGDGNSVTNVMKLLSDNVILGAAHDDSARVPPPRCHPGTRIKLLARITAWFNGNAQPDLLLWLTGPAGVGKSAIVQTFAEYLIEPKLLGASVFCSRPNKRNNPHRVFITIAYQLATRIEPYREFIVGRLSLDPQLLNRDIAAQFKTFIIEPFVEKKIGAGGRRWGILLDGLDELEGEDAQCEIVQLISTFTLEHPGAPLIWVIASRPELHIRSTFADDGIRQSHWSEYIPIDSTEACEDVERYIRSSFKVVQKKYRHSISSDWPSDTELLKITAAASGLFVYAEVVMQFIRDPGHADPISRLGVLLSVIDRSNVVSTKDHPFVYLDALYAQILSSIPSTQWPTAKKLLCFTIHGERIRIKAEVRIPQNFQTLRGMSILFDMHRHVVYACLNKCRSTLRIPDWKVAHKEKLTFLHASFADYLKDPSRSGEFYVGSVEDARRDLVSGLFEIWGKCSGDNIAAALVESTWHQYCSKRDDKTPSKAITKFDGGLFQIVVGSIRCIIPDILMWPSESSPLYALLHKVHMIKLCHYFTGWDVWNLVVALVGTNVNSIGLLREVQLEKLNFGHLDLKEMSPAQAQSGTGGEGSKEYWKLQRPHSSVDLKSFVSELKSIQEGSPQLEVVVFGGIPEGRVAVFRHGLRSGPGLLPSLFRVLESIAAVSEV